MTQPHVTPYVPMTFGNSTNISCRHQLDDNDADTAPYRKRTRQSSHVNDNANDDTVALDYCESTKQVHIPSQDEILIDMIKQSGAKSYDEITKFCLSTGIPMSRLLRLDLMRLLEKR
jgi:hypothetical protein